MSACKAVCGNEAPNHLCDACDRMWRASMEFGRALEMANDASVGVEEHDVRFDIAFVDFCTRVRMERQNRPTP